MTAITPILALFLGCPSAETLPEPEPVVEPQPQSRLGTIKSGEDPALPLVSAFAFRKTGTDLVTIRAFTTEKSCEDAARNGIRLSGDEQYVQVDLYRALARDGSFKWSVSGVSSNRAKLPRGVTPQVNIHTVNSAAGASTKLDVTADLESSRSPPVRVEATLDAVGCGDVSWRDSAESIPQPDGKLTVAGHEIQVVGATWNGERLILSAAPRDCKNSGESNIDVWLEEDQAQLTGGWLGGSGSVKSKNFREGEGPQPKARSKDGAVAVSGDFEGDIGGFALAVSGTWRAQDCSKQ